MEAVLLVACAGTVAVLANRLVAAIAGFVFVRTIIAGMTTRTVGLEGGVLPDNHFRVVLVAVGTGEVAAMVKRFKRCRRVSEIVRLEGIGVVALIALPGRHKMSGILADCGCAIVTRRTGAKHLGVVNVEHRRPDSRCMAVFTDVRCKRVLRVFTGCNAAVVTANAITRYVRMVEGGGRPRDGGVAVITIVAARDMRWMFAGRRNAIVAGAATSQDLRVIYSIGRHPDINVVTVLANISGLHVCGILAGGGNTVVAVAAVAGDAGMVEVSRHPADSCMTIVTGIAAINMGRVLASGGNPIVTAVTGANNLRVIHR